MTLQALLQAVGSIFTQLIDWVGDIVQVITDNPLLLIFVVISLAFTGVAMIRRLLRL